MNTFRQNIACALAYVSHKQRYVLNTCLKLSVVTTNSLSGIAARQSFADKGAELHNEDAYATTLSKDPHDFDAKVWRCGWYFICKHRH